MRSNWIYAWQTERTKVSSVTVPCVLWPSRLLALKSGEGWSWPSIWRPAISEVYWWAAAPSNVRPVVIYQTGPTCRPISSRQISGSIFPSPLYCLGQKLVPRPDTEVGARPRRTTVGILKTGQFNLSEKEGTPGWAHSLDFRGQTKRGRNQQSPRSIWLRPNASSYPSMQGETHLGGPSVRRRSFSGMRMGGAHMGRVSDWERHHHDANSSQSNDSNLV